MAETDGALTASPGAAGGGTTLVVLAAGMGSRFGGLKQLAPLWPRGETLLEYSVYDAARAGFERAVVVLRSSFEPTFRDTILPRLSSHIDVDYVAQDSDPIAGSSNGRPAGIWGTAHAALVAGRKIEQPFAVINADDFYGRQAFAAARDALEQRQSHSGRYVLISYRLGATLSPNGPVSRAICELDGNKLVSLVEHARLTRSGDQAASLDSDPPEIFDLATPVSMNFWGFTPDILDKLRPQFDSFLGGIDSSPDGEFLLPQAVHRLLGSDDAEVEVLPAGTEWFGMTYRADHEAAVNRLARLIDSGVYPERLDGAPA